MVDKIDISDFTFAEGNKRFKIEANSQNQVFVDAAPFGVAMNNNISHQSQFKIDLRSQPFHFKFTEWGKFGDQANIKKQKGNTQTSWWSGCGNMGGCAPKLEEDSVQDMKSYFP